MKRSFLLWLPFVLGIGLMIGFYVGLKNPSDRIIASNLVGEPLPDFVAVAALPGRDGTSAADLRDGKPRLLNVFASWCVPCVREVGVLRDLQAQGAEIAGIAIHDSPQAVSDFLARNGDPYSSIGFDPEGRTQLAFGSTGVPETFVIDGQGKIAYQHIGVVTEADIPMLLDMLVE